MAELVRAEPKPLPLGPIGDYGVGRDGLIALIVSEGALFGYLLFSYYYIGASALLPWVLEAEPSLKLAGPNTILLLLSSVAIWFAEKATRKGNRGGALTGTGIALLLGIAFAAIQWFEWKAKHFGFGTSSYGSLYFVTTGFHMAHVLVGLVVLTLLFAWTALGYFSPVRRLGFTMGSYYWHFVDAVWLLVFTTYYITPYLGFGR